MNSFGSTIKCLLLVAILACGSRAAPQELDPADDVEAMAEQSPEPNRLDSQNRSDPAPAPGSTSASICLLVESAAQAHGLAFEFFARLIWQESRFKPSTVGPTTRGGQRAEGIAQFMP